MHNHLTPKGTAKLSLLVALTFATANFLLGQEFEYPYPKRRDILSENKKRILHTPFTGVALVLAKHEAAKPFILKSVAAPLIDARMWGDWLMRALEIKAELVDRRAFAGSLGNGIPDMILTRYNGAVPFELRQTEWVWVLKISKAALPQNATGKQTPVGALSMLTNQFAEGGAKAEREIANLPVLSGTIPNLLKGDDLPFFIKETVILETNEAFILCGSKVVFIDIDDDMTGHKMDVNQSWFKNYGYTEEAPAPAKGGVDAPKPKQALPPPQPMPVTLPPPPAPQSNRGNSGTADNAGYASTTATAADSRSPSTTATAGNTGGGDRYVVEPNTLARHGGVGHRWNELAVAHAEKAGKVRESSCVLGFLLKGFILNFLLPTIQFFARICPNLPSLRWASPSALHP